MRILEYLKTHPKTARLFLIIFGCALSLILVEIVLRGLEYYEYIKPANRIQFESYKKIFSDERDQDYVYGHKPNIKVILEKGYYNFTFITNSQGLREEKNYNELSKSIIFLGDSIVEGCSVENNEIMDSIFEQQTGIVTLNFGIASSNTVHQYHWLKAKYKPEYKAQLIVLGFCLNDLNQNAYLRYFDVDKGNWRKYKHLELDKSDHQIKKILQNSSTSTFLENVFHDNLPAVYEEASENGKIFTELYLQKINDFAHSIDAKFMVVIFPLQEQLKVDYGKHKRVQDAVIEILERNQILYIDLYEVIKKSYVAKPEIRWYHDNIHPYKAGHKLIGEYLAKELPQIFPQVFD